jgi:N-acetylmuramoyl-L-alanine amidase
MKPTKITIHCSDTPNGKPFFVEDIRRWHKARGWRDCGYHKVICIDGGVQQGRPDTQLGAHVEGHNTGNIGICMIGRDKFNRAQFEALRWVLDSLTRAYNIGVDQIFCHYEFDSAIKQGKQCPNMTISRLKAWYVHGVDDAIAQYILDPVTLP